MPLRAGGLWWPSPEAPSRSPPRPPPSDPRRRSPGTVQICIRKNASINRNWNEMMEFPTVSCNDELLKLRYASVEGRHQGIQRCSGFVLVHLSLRSWMKQILLICCQFRRQCFQLRIYNLFFSFTSFLGLGFVIVTKQEKYTMQVKTWWEKENKYKKKYRYKYHM